MNSRMKNLRRKKLRRLACCMAACGAAGAYFISQWKQSKDAGDDKYEEKRLIMKDVFEYYGTNSVGGTCCRIY